MKPCARIWRIWCREEESVQCPIQARENAELLLAYCTRKLDPDTTALLERHVAACPDCQAFAETQRLVWSALDAWEAMPVSVDFDRRLYRRIQEREQSAWWRRPLAGGVWFSWRPALSLAAASVALVAVLLLQNPPAPPPQDRAEAVDIEQVERSLEDVEMLGELYFPTHAEAAASRSL
jgi:hypothetical protein